MEKLSKEYLQTKNSIEYWIAEANEVMTMIEGDNVCSALCIASYLRSFYLQGKEHGVWLYNNTIEE